MHRDVLVAKLEARTRGIANLTVIRDAQQASLDKLIAQTGEHEVAMAECDGASTGKQRWLKWAEQRLKVMNDQRTYFQHELDMTNASIGRLKAEANGFQREIHEIEAAKEREVKRTLRATIAAVEGREVGKNPGRKYYKPGEHPNYGGRKRTEQQESKKKDKKNKAQQQGRKKGKGHQIAA